MLLPDNINPELSVYYNGALVIKELQNINKQRIFDLYQNLRKGTDMSFSTFILSLDWLYLINIACINKNGEVELCS